ncbi:hypothetical protein [Nocardia carnea]|uniref:hypothetical protein n=1 Tax=Nocardia carnea TaxID=37328 RepID=UPI002457C645|nr:hypothetical protein [Nocardia carnea]
MTHLLALRGVGRDDWIDTGLLRLDEQTITVQSPTTPQPVLRQPPRRILAEIDANTST